MLTPVLRCLPIVVLWAGFFMLLSRPAYATCLGAMRRCLRMDQWRNDFMILGNTQVTALFMRFENNNDNNNNKTNMGFLILWYYGPFWICMRLYNYLGFVAVQPSERAKCNDHCSCCYGCWLPPRPYRSILKNVDITF